MSRHAFGFLLVFIGGGIGSMFRHASNQIGSALFGPDFPYGTIFVNIAGSLAIGLIAGWLALHGGSGQMLSLFLMTGIVGGFTTFSAFTLDTALMWERGQPARAGLYVLASTIPGVIAVFLGLAIMRSLWK
jgi:fluoride exporter